MAWADDLDDLHDAVFETFGEPSPAEFRAAPGDPAVDTSAVVNRDVEIVSPGRDGFGEIVERRTTLYLPADDITEIGQGSTVTIDADVYVVDRVLGNDGYMIEALTR